VVVADDAPSGAFELVGHSPLNNRGMNAALGVHGDYVYVGSRTDAKLENANGAGVLVVDVSKPDAPEVVKEIGPPNEANPGETSREMRVWRSQDLLLVMNLYSNCGEIHGCTPTEAADNFRFYDISGKNAADPKLVATYEPSVDPHEFYLWEDPKNPKRALLFLSTPGGGQTQLMVTDISNYKKEKFPEIGKYSFAAGEPGNDNRLHSFAVSPDGKTGYLAYLEAGFLVLDTSEIAAGAKKPEVTVLTDPKDAPKWPEAPGPGIHSAVPFFGRDFVMTTDEVYGEALRPLNAGGCPWGWAKFLDVRNPAKPKVISEFKLPQNEESYCALPEVHEFAPRSQHPMSSFAAHNPTLTKNLAVLTWHAGGLQAINISNPAKPTQAAEYLPLERGAILVETELAQEPRPGPEPPLERRDDRIRLRDPGARRAHAREAPGSIRAKQEDARLVRVPDGADELHGTTRPRTSPSGSPRRTTSSPSSRNVRSLPSSSRTGSAPFRVSSIRLPSLPRSAPEIVPDAITSPARMLAPFTVACASCCGIVQ
jgi:hypothetical protein